MAPLSCYVQGQQTLVSKLKAINERKYAFHVAQDYGCYVLFALSTCVTSSVIFVMNVAIAICMKLHANFYQVM